MAFVPKYILILFSLITVDFFLAFLIHKADKRRKAFLIISIIINISTLFFFRYFNFFNINLNLLAHFFHFNYDPILLKIILPLGLSFHIFQSLSYVIEVYRKKYDPEKNYINYALYVMFFPQLVSGPIERPQNLLPQINTDQTFDRIKAKRGLERILWGFFKKLVIADQFSFAAFAMLHNQPLESTTLICVMVMYTYQIYCDFSGYTDIAIGSAMLFGFDLMENFNRPFSASTISEFWRKWHISLSSWLRDYLYYPIIFSLGKISRYKLYFTTCITFTLIGLWHGANWTYVVFGALQGLYIMVGNITENIRKKISEIIGISKIPKLHRAIQIIIVFILFAFSQIFFRAENLYQAIITIKYIFTAPHMAIFRSNIAGLQGSILIAAVSVVCMEIVQYYQAKKDSIYIFESKPKKLRYAWYYGLAVSIILLGNLAGASFIYFKF